MNNSNQKNYNKQILNSGKKSIQYIDESLANLNRYSNDYAGRLDFWSDKVNNRQLDLLADEYLASNARMLRGQGQFGSNSALNREQEQNAYDQQNYLANVANTNVQLANALQNNELNALYNNVNLNYSNRDAGAQAAANLDQMNNSWLNWLSPVASAAGVVSTAMGQPALGYALSSLGSTMAAAGTASSQPAISYQYQSQAKDYSSQLGQWLKNNTNLSSGTTTSGTPSLFSTTQGYRGNLPKISQ